MVMTYRHMGGTGFTAQTMAPQVHLLPQDAIIVCPSMGAYSNNFRACIAGSPHAGVQVCNPAHCSPAQLRMLEPTGSTAVECIKVVGRSSICAGVQAQGADRNMPRQESLRTCQHQHGPGSLLQETAVVHPAELCRCLPGGGCDPESVWLVKHLLCSACQRQRSIHGSQPARQRRRHPRVDHFEPQPPSGADHRCRPSHPG